MHENEASELFFFFGHCNEKKIGKSRGGRRVDADEAVHEGSKHTSNSQMAQDLKEKDMAELPGAL